ncbi:hypothetical protein chiPu_0018403 [Chiloscyllium punctatum]|uniref:Uncharacterized protein n=1 Tax=Chiloscyllium punctatum TaxID=137246 RepID=A0A401RN12_CHIPU|nr:hypothetical protein [Chiloscyllium punctatum]
MVAGPPSDPDPRGVGKRAGFAVPCPYAAEANVRRNCRNGRRRSVVKGHGPVLKLCKGDIGHQARADPIFLVALSRFLSDTHNGVPVNRYMAARLADISLEVGDGNLLFAMAVAEVSAPGPILVRLLEPGPQVLQEVGSDQAGHVPIVKVVADLHLPKPLPKFSIIVPRLKGGEPVQQFHGVAWGQRDVGHLKVRVMGKGRGPSPLPSPGGISNFHWGCKGIACARFPGVRTVLEPLQVPGGECRGAGRIR